MDSMDDKGKKDEKQTSLPSAGPIFKSEPVEVSEQPQIQPEEVAPEVENPNPEEIAHEKPEIPTDVPPPVYQENKNKYFIIIGGVVFFLVMLFLLMRLFLGGGSKQTQVNLTYWGLWEDEQVMKPVIEDYQKKNPKVRITYKKMSKENYREKLLAQTESGQGPDIFRFHNTWLPEIRKVAAPIPPKVMTNADFEKTFYKIHQTDLKVGNYYYGLPLMIDGLVLISNESLLKKAGIENPPATWDEITDAVGKLTVKDGSGKLITSGIALGTASNIEHFSDVLVLMFGQNGADLQKLDQPEAASALQAYRAFAEPPNAFWTEDMPNSVNAFIQEKVAMIIAPSWELLTIKSVNPDLNIRVSAVPSVPGSSPLSIASYWVEGVSRSSKNQIEAWNFLTYLIQKDTLSKLYAEETKVRPFGEPYSRVDMANLLVQDPYVGPVVRQADSFISMPAINRTYDNGLNDQIVQYLENAINATIQGVSYEEALSTAKKGIDQVFKQYSVQ